MKRIASFKTRKDALDAIAEMRATGRLGQFRVVRVLTEPYRIASRWEFDIEVAAALRGAP